MTLADQTKILSVDQEVYNVHGLITQELFVVHRLYGDTRNIAADVLQGW
jgi:hypothetical protein